MKMWSCALILQENTTLNTHILRRFTLALALLCLQKILTRAKLKIQEHGNRRLHQNNWIYIDEKYEQVAFKTMTNNHAIYSPT